MGVQGATISPMAGAGKLLESKTKLPALLFRLLLSSSDDLGPKEISDSRRGAARGDDDEEGGGTVQSLSQGTISTIRSAELSQGTIPSPPPAAPRHFYQPVGNRERINKCGRGRGRGSECIWRLSRWKQALLFAIVQPHCISRKGSLASFAKSYFFVSTQCRY